MRGEGFCRRRVFGNGGESIGGANRRGKVLLKYVAEDKIHVITGFVFNHFRSNDGEW